MSCIELTSASAGTGKTTALIGKILELLDSRPASELVAITFTNAAVREIRERISKKVNIDELNISTIHSFFASILREQSLIIGISPVFKILDSDDSAYMFREICKEIIISNLQDNVCKNIIADYGYEHLLSIMIKLEGKYPLFRKNSNYSYQDFIELERDAEQKKLLEILGDNFVDDVLLVLKDIECSNYENTLDKSRRCLLPFAVQLSSLVLEYNINYKDRTLFKKISKILKEIEKIKAVKRMSSLKGWQNEQEMIAVQEAIIKFNNVIDSVSKLKLGDDTVSELAAVYEDLVVKLFNQIHHEFSQRKIELEVLDYNDIEMITYDLIIARPEISDIYTKKYSYILVDEYQDTNVMQRDILLKLSNEFYFVGDAKQSIYRFRNADVSVFIETEKTLKTGGANELNCNYRSKENIVTFVNDFFDVLFNTWVEKKSEFDADYKKVISHRTGEGGLVEIINTGIDNSTVLDVYKEAQCVVNLIKKGIHNGRRIGDYAILFRAKENMGIFEKLLRENSIPCSVFGKSKRDDAIRIIKSVLKAINNPYENFYMFCICKLPFFYLADETIFKLKVDNKYLWDGIRNYDISSNPQIIPDYDLESIRKIVEYIKTSRANKLILNFQEFIISILKSPKIIPTIAVLYPGQEHGFEEYILNLANKVEKSGYDIERFIDYLCKADVGGEAYNSENNLVSIMTVHSAKGLQFPVTILPCLQHEAKFNDWLVISSKGEISLKIHDEDINKKVNTALYGLIRDYEYRAELAESKRLLYVAITRAMDELYLIGNFNSPAKKSLSNAESTRWIDWIYRVFRSEIKQAGLEDSTGSINLFKPERCVVKINEDRALYAKDKITFVIKSHNTVSTIRDFIKKTKTEATNELYKNLGEITHLVLEKYDDKDAVNQILSDLSESKQKNVVKIVDGFYDSKIGKLVFKDTEKYLMEYPFVLNLYNNIINGRIDRLNIYDDRIWVIDYKVGINFDNIDSYKIQMAIYFQFASLMFPDKDISGSIIDVVDCKEYSYSFQDLVPLLENTFIAFNKSIIE